MLTGEFDPEQTLVCSGMPHQAMTSSLPRHFNAPRYRLPLLGHRAPGVICYLSLSPLRVETSANGEWSLIGPSERYAANYDSARFQLNFPLTLVVARIDELHSAFIDFKYGNVC